MTEPAVGLVVVFDTNALLPLLVGATRRAQTLRRLWRARRFELCITPQSLIEVERVLTYPYYHGTQIISLAQFTGLFVPE